MPLTFSQNRFWFLDQFAANRTAAVIVVGMRVRGAFRPDVFGRACADVVRRHESLRTVFFDVDGRPFQRVRADLPPEVSIRDLRGAEPDAVSAQVSACEADLSSRPFDLTTGPLLRVALLRVTVDETVVLLSCHHIVSDRWSMSVLMRELTQAYGAQVTGQPSSLPDLPVQFGDFAAWQQESTSEQAWAADLAYWRRKLAGLPAEIGLPLDRPRPKEKSYRGASIPVELAPALVARLRTLAKAEGATLFMTLEAAFTVLLSRLSGSEDIVVGTPVANRPLLELEPLIGLFINTLALRTDLTGDPSFRELLRRVRDVCLQAYDHQSVPFERLVEEIQPERSLARTPVFGVLFGYGNVPFPGWDHGAVRVEPIPLRSRKSGFDLSLDLFEDGETIWGRLEYSVDIIDEASARRMVSVFQRLLRGLAADPDQRIGALPVLGAEERQQVLATSRGPDRDWPGQGWVHQCVEDRVREAPDAAAVRFEGQRLSYRELNRRANQLAHRLRRLGVGPDVLVGISMERSVELVVSLLAVLKAGGAYVPLDPGYPPARLRYMLSDTQVPVLLTQRRLVPVLPEPAAEVLCVDELDAELAVEPAENLDLDLDGEDLAYVIYTSGSTGTPKGAMNVRAAIRNRMLWMQDHFGLETSDRVLQKAPFSFDVSVWEFCWPLMNGATLVLARPEGHKDSRYLVDLIRAEGITVTHFVPSMFQAFLREPDVAECSTLRLIICGGETLPHELHDRCLSLLPARLFNSYGPTEAAIGISTWPCRLDGARRPIPIGYPIPNTQLYVLDRNLRPVPTGVAGELFIGGRSLARGYLNQPELTAEKFIPNPLDPGSGSRLYRTGDLARYREDGAIEYLGRLDHQVKLRGFRVELGEIELVLAAHPWVREAIAVVREVGAGDVRLVAYLTGGPAGGPADNAAGGAADNAADNAAGDGVPRPADLAAFVKERLPEYMVPSAFVILPAIPLMPNGKVDRAALPEPEFARPDLESPFVPPRDDLERSIAGFWTSALGVERVGVQDNFFELGGHSLLAIQAVAQIASAHGVHVPVREFFDNPTVAALATWVRERVAAGAPGPAPIPVVDRAAGVPLSFAQERLCRNHPVGVEEPYHNVLTAVVLSGPLDADALRRGLDDLVRRHEALRTRIVHSGTRWTQVVEETGSWPLATVDLRTWPEDTRPAEVRRLVQELGRRRFRIAEEPLVRGVLVPTGPAENVLALVIHHLVTDNWSYGVLVRDLCLLYEAHTRGRAPRLPELTVGYPDVAAWQREQLVGGALDEHVRYWHEQLAELPPPLRFDAPEYQLDTVATGHSQAFGFDAAATAALREIGQRAGATSFMVLMAAFDLLLSAYSGSDDVPVAFPDAGRERPETAGLVGFFVNSLVVRADLSGNPTFRDLVGQVRDATLGAHAHQGVPLRSLEAATGGGHDPFRIVFNMLNAPMPALDLPGLRAAPLDTDSAYVFAEVAGSIEPADVDLALIMRADGDRLRGMWLYALERIDARVVAALMRRWARVIELVGADPDLGVDELRRAVLAPEQG